MTDNNGKVKPFGIKDKLGYIVCTTTQTDAGR